jgi:hypothetical protein
MFATLLGPLPRPPVDDQARPEAVLDAILELQTEHGLEPVTDGRPPVLAGRGSTSPGSADAPAAWRLTTTRTDALVKSTLVGPFTAGSDGTAERRVVLELAAAGCRWIEIHEPAAIEIGDDAGTRARFVDLHQALTADLADVHLSLAITGGAAASAGIGTLLAGAYSSLAVDLIDGPDNWDLVVGTPGDRGIVAGVVAPRPGTDDGPEVMLWAAAYAASTGGRGMDRVGLATASSYADLPWEVADTKIRRLGDALRLANAPVDERLAAMDPHAIDPRSAALGRHAPRPGLQTKRGET